MTDIVLFDLDGTLTPLPSAEWRFVAFLLRRRHLGARALLRSAAFALRHWPTYGRHVWKKNKAYLAGLPVAEVARWGAEFAHGGLAPRVRPHVLQALRAHQARGHRIALLTGTADFIAAPLCELLGLSECVATRCAVADGRFLGHVPERHPFADAKLGLARELCARLGGRVEEAWAYADSIHDASLLAAAGHPVAVHPDAALRRLAAERRWPVLEADVRP